MRGLVGHWLYTLMLLLRPIWWLWWRFRFLGAESIPKTGPALVVANHSCFLDPYFIAMVFPRKVRWLCTREWYYRSPFWQWFFERFATIPVQETPEATLDLVRQRLAHSEIVGVFPEGRISNDGRIQKLEEGITGVPIA